MGVNHGADVRAVHGSFAYNRGRRRRPSATSLPKLPTRAICGCIAICITNLNNYDRVLSLFGPLSMTGTNFLPDTLHTFRPTLCVRRIYDIGCCMAPPRIDATASRIGIVRDRLRTITSAAVWRRPVIDATTASASCTIVLDLLFLSRTMTSVAVWYRL